MRFNNVLRALSLAGIATTALLLAGCGVSATPTTPTAAPAPISTTPAPAITEVYPAVGIQQGVVKSGKSVKEDPSTGNRGIAYTCAPGLTSIQIGFLQTVEYNGAAIGFSQETYKSGNNNNQLFVTVTMSDPTGKLTPVSVIVIMDDYDTDSKLTTDNQDDQVVNLGRGLVGKPLRMTDINFTRTRISSLVFCVAPMPTT